MNSLATGMVRTVTGDIDPTALGVTNYHEHLFQVSPLLPEDELDDFDKSSMEAGLLTASGFDAMVDATPLGLGQSPDALATISAAVGLTIIATTGRHREEHYPSGHWVHDFTETTLVNRLTNDLSEGMLAELPGDKKSSSPPTMSGVRAGILKAGINYWQISPFEHMTLHAVAQAHHHTGAPIMIHLEFGTAAHEILDLFEHLSVPASSVALAHMDRNLDSGLHVSLIERGAYLGYDGMARAKSASDEDLLILTQKVVERAGSDRLLLGGDVARASRYVSYGGMPGLQYLADRYLPRLRQQVGEFAVSEMLVANSASWLRWSPTP